MGTWSCEEETVDCAPFDTAVADALTAYTTDRTEVNCTAYQAALQAGIDEGCDSTNVYQTELDNLDCGCIALDEAVATASAAFISDPSTDNCITYKTALQAAVDGNCDPNGLYLETINTLGDCSNPASSLECVSLISGVVTASLEYTMDPTNETCNAYGDSLMFAILGGCDADSVFQNSFDSLACDSIIITPGDIEEAAGLVTDANEILEDVFSQLYDSDEADTTGIFDMLDFSEAYSIYSEAQYLDPNNDDANFGVALTGLMEITQSQTLADMLENWENYFDANPLWEVQTGEVNILGRGGFGLPLTAKGLRIPVSSFVGAPLSLARITVEDVPQLSELQNIIRYELLPHVVAGMEALAKVEQNADYVFTISSGMQPDVDASSMELDLTEVYAIDMMLHALSAVCNTMIAYNFDFVSYDGTGMETAFNQGSAFAALNSSGATELTNAYSSMNGAIDKLEAAINNLKAESDDQDDDIIPQFESESDYDDIQDGIDGVREVLTQPNWVYYSRWEEGEDENGYWYENEIEDSIEVDIQQFFSNPIEDMKEMVPPYTVTAGIDTSYDYHWEEYYEYVSVTVESDSDDVNNDWYYYFFYYYDYYDDSLRIYGDGPQELPGIMDEIYENVMNQYPEIEWLHIGADYYGQAGDINLEIRVEFEWGEFEGFYNYPIITWDAVDFNDWKNGWPDHSFNGLFPSWTLDDFMEFMGFEEEDWEKVWD